MLWAAETGIWIGVMYLLLRPGVAVKSPLFKAAFFGVVVIGIDLFMFTMFIPLVFETNILDLFVRVAIDIISVTVGVYICEKIYSYIGMGAKPALSGTKS